MNSCLYVQYFMIDSCILWLPVLQLCKSCNFVKKSVQVSICKNYTLLLLTICISVYHVIPKLCIVTPLVGRLTTALYRDLPSLPSPPLPSPPSHSPAPSLQWPKISAHLKNCLRSTLKFSHQPLVRLATYMKVNRFIAANERRPVTGSSLF